MEHFWKTVEVIPEGIGFAHYGTLHLCWLAAFAVLLVLNCILYRRLDGKGRKLWRIVVAVLLVLDEVYKQIPLFVNGLFTLEYTMFQSTHPCRVRLRSESHQSTFPIQFQSTHPCRVRPILSCSGITQSVFQSTHPCRVRRAIFKTLICRV